LGKARKYLPKVDKKLTIIDPSARKAVGNYLILAAKPMGRRVNTIEGWREKESFTLSKRGLSVTGPCNVGSARQG
jgi:hypothetical protein